MCWNWSSRQASGLDSKEIRIVEMRDAYVCAGLALSGGKLMSYKEEGITMRRLLERERDLPEVPAGDVALDSSLLVLFQRDSEGFRGIRGD